MHLNVKREPSNDQCTFGQMFVDGEPECTTLEDVERPEKIKGITAIPKGTYPVVMCWSQKFRQFLPLLLNVPNYVGVRIHPGNRAEDTEGCILVGEKRSEHGNSVVNSRLAFGRLYEKMYRASKREQIWITIE